MTNKEMIRIRDNEKCFNVAEKIKNYACGGMDMYSVAASYIFDKPYHKCTEYEGGERNNEGTKRRKFAKKLLLAHHLFEEIYKDIYDGSGEELKLTLMKKFPYTPYDEINDDLTDEDRWINTCSFISCIFGYIRMYKFFEDHHISTRKYNNAVPECSDLFK